MINQTYGGFVTNEGLQEQLRKKDVQLLALQNKYTELLHKWAALTKKNALLGNELRRQGEQHARI